MAVPDRQITNVPSMATPDRTIEESDVRLVVETSDQRLGVIVGYGPGPKGSPRAIVVFPDGTFGDFALGDIHAGQLGRKARRKIACRLGITPDALLYSVN